MIAVALKTDDACFFPSTVLYLRISAAAVEVVTTQGTARFESNHPRYLLRDLMGGRINEITTGLKIGQSPMDYTVHSSTLAKRHTHNPSVGAAVPENVPLPKRVILFETVAFGDYHPFDSLEIVGIKRNGNLVFGLIDTTYELTFPLDADARKVFRAAVDFAADPRGHFTSRPRNDYLDCLEWICGKRIHCDELVEVQHRPETWGRAVEIVSDFRDDPDHTAFRARKPPFSPRPGIDF